MFRFFCLLIFGFIFHISFAQDYDVKYYNLELDIDVKTKSISGSNQIYFESSDVLDSMAIHLFDNFLIDSILYANQTCDFRHDNNSITIFLENFVLDQKTHFLHVFYRGTPIVAKNPPWDGGFVWAQDNNQNDWVGVACQGIGASVWWPNHDVLYDEPDSMQVSIMVPHHLQAISNGNLIVRKDTLINGISKSIFRWKILNPINNYNVTMNIGDYMNFTDTLTGLDGLLHLDYYVIRDNFLLAKKHFEQVKPMLHFFEETFGPYPFYSDGYCLVETSYLGMEHQSCIAYGNKFKKGYLGYFPGKIDFDFIIIHETAHEWWGNSLSMEDISDMWIHEAFATYSEALYVEEMYGYDHMLLYLQDQKKRIKNHIPITSDSHSATDMYYKGSWMLHTLRTLLEDDDLWRSILRGLQIKFRHKTVDRNDIIQYINEESGYDFLDFFNQYLNQAELPIFEYYITKKKKKYFLHFRWNAIEKFDMPVLTKINSEDYNWIYPDKTWKKIKLQNIEENEFKIAENLFLIDVNKIK